jgi:hypothetical protein
MTANVLDILYVDYFMSDLSLKSGSSSTRMIAMTSCQMRVVNLKNLERGAETGDQES